MSFLVAHGAMVILPLTKGWSLESNQLYVNAKRKMERPVTDTTTSATKSLNLLARSNNNQIAQATGRTSDGDPMNLMTDINIFVLVVTLIGWAFNLGILWQMSRSHKEKLEKHDSDIIKINDRIDKHHEEHDIHTSGEWREDVRGMLNALSNKMDDLQKQCLNRITKGVCE
jgi:hypothetical protein